MLLSHKVYEILNELLKSNKLGNKNPYVLFLGSNPFKHRSELTFSSKLKRLFLVSLDCWASHSKRGKPPWVSHISP